MDVVEIINKPEWKSHERDECLVSIWYAKIISIYRSMMQNCRTILQKFFLSFLEFILCVSFASKSLFTSFINVMINQHEPTMNDMLAQFIKRLAYVAARNSNKIAAYPNGVLQLYGNLWKETKCNLTLICWTIFLSIWMDAHNSGW